MDTMMASGIEAAVRLVGRATRHDATATVSRTIAVAREIKDDDKGHRGGGTVDSEGHPSRCCC